ncbi:MAG: phosphohydrolase [Sulfurihydrogenibium sp.]|uniref:phosphohydrolase n=1 Tax=Sulfurihydrogenibium sp. TaxID=2053621 RepID=UPI003C7ECC65
MKKFVKWLILVLAVLGIGYFAYSRREKLKEQLEEIESKIKESRFSKNIKEKFQEAIDSLKAVIEKEEKVDTNSEDIILNIVEEKIKKLEELIKQEERK